MLVPRVGRGNAHGTYLVASVRTAPRAVSSRTEQRTPRLGDDASSRRARLGGRARAARAKGRKMTHTLVHEAATRVAFVLLLSFTGATTSALAPVQTAPPAAVLVAPASG